ncbi:3-oxoadipate enol-lactonase [Antarcticimicrobium luteum]|uniref:3-oxoadipate enol-lactonase n=1 Tax=Antarcticimicrobium luteum TaxID=2547397 RepID=A0A4R5VEG3_9RHOB|nr:3-oxoadipate enol-lactonase [Antarcticimicrobium luteum]TDK50579.1 3-oxoadipate enol-lactonase [Antarcticimicrobium luteum]
MQLADLGDVRLHYRIDGDPAGAPVVFSNSLGTDLRLWDAVLPLLPQGLKFIRYDMRGHGLSSMPEGPYAMGALVRDAERLLDHLEVRDCVFVGLSIGGMIAQGLAVKRLDQIRALVLSNTGAKIGTKQMWDERIAQIRAHGLDSAADATMERWFGKAFRESAEIALWRNMLTRQPLDGYLGCAAAIGGTDFYTPTSGLRLPALGIAGDADGATPPDLVRETVDLIPGSTFHLIRGAGHLPCVDQPVAYAGALTGFLTQIGHV